MTEPGPEPPRPPTDKVTRKLDRPPVDRLYGRRRGHALRPRQEALLERALPRLAFPQSALGDPRAAFDAPPRELWLEVGFGGGEHARSLAAAHPEAALIAAEVFENGITSMLSALVPEPLDPDRAPLPGNLRLWTQDARSLIDGLPDGCLDRLMLMFPDPWPKARHARRRFVHPGTLARQARVLRPGGEWRIATDEPTYQAWVEESFAAQTLFRLAFSSLSRPEGWPGTRYESKALREGRHPRWWSFVRI